jgi:hypothetical protein
VEHEAAAVARLRLHHRHEPRLAHPGLPREHDELRLARERRRDQPVEHAQRLFAADDRAAR